MVIMLKRVPEAFEVFLVGIGVRPNQWGPVLKSLLLIDAIKVAGRVAEGERRACPRSGGRAPKSDPGIDTRVSGRPIITRQEADRDQ